MPSFTTPPTATAPILLPNSSSRPPLPSTFHHTFPQPTLHYQGAEALLYSTTYLTTTTPCALKHRPSKPYRHPILDAKLTRHRILSEARVLVRLRREGVAVPALYALDWEEGWIMCEWIGGGTVRGVLDVLLERFVMEGREGDGVNGERGKEEGLWGLMGRIGRLVASCHQAGVIHGDLTTSNIMLRQPPSTSTSTTGTPTPSSTPTDPSILVNADPILIDFGLASTSSQEEDRAVDLYVLERAFGSTHPRAEGLFGEVLRAYGEGYKGAKGVLRRYEEVRMRGRKKILIG